MNDQNNLTKKGDAAQYKMYDIAIAYLNNNITLFEYDQAAIDFLNGYAADHSTQRVKELEAWKREQIECFAPLLDYGQSAESGIKLGASIVAAAIGALKEKKLNDARIAELEKELAERTKERDILAEVVVHDTDFVKSNQKAAIDMRLERNQAFDLLEKLDNIDQKNRFTVMRVLNSIKADISRLLSLRENEKP